ncbi:YunG [Candidatus Saccharibacteria bacterium RAAC3_TM7_1]|nr:YunG [Candidatus Saccharibacteria bacterium RAAC3_TM7_1]HCZ28398.1 hypothetical protein [Candidatus Saccharibacteria bacterium]
MKYEGTPKFLGLLKAMQDSWGPETSLAGDKLPSDNPARGQCVVSSLVVQDFLGGDIVRVHVTGDGIDENHYFNKLADGTAIDVTRKQYEDKPITLVDHPPDLESNGYSSMRERCLADDDTRRRYMLLKGMVDQKLAELQG